MNLKSVAPTIYGEDYFLHAYNGEIDKYLSNLDGLPAALSGCFDVAEIKPGERVLDLGCGRGHLSYSCALSHCLVTAVDYSEDAIRLAKLTMNRLPLQLRKNVTVIQESISELELSDKYDVIFMADLVEHLYDWELKNLFERVKIWLKEDTGRVIIRTAPNVLWVKYIYPLKRILDFPMTLRKKLNVFYRRNRYRYDPDMHVNEQTPRKLKKLLKDFDAKVWCYDNSSNIISILTKRFCGQDILAIARLKR